MEKQKKTRENKRKTNTENKRKTNTANKRKTHAANKRKPHTARLFSLVLYCFLLFFVNHECGMRAEGDPPGSAWSHYFF